jgi:hypothetical protein
VNIVPKTNATATQERSLHSKESENTMPAEQQKTVDDEIDWAGAQISHAIDTLLAALPVDSDRTEIAHDLMDCVASISDYPQFVAMFTEGLLARRVLTELGIKF